MQKLSVKLKVTLWYTLVMIILATIVLFAMTSFNRGYVERDMTERLQRTVDNAAHQMDDGAGGNPNAVSPEANRMPRRPMFAFYERGVHMGIYDETGTLIAGQIPFELPEKPTFEEGAPRAESYDGEQYFIYDKQGISPSGKMVWIRGVVSMTEEYYALDSAFRLNLILTSVLILLAAAGGYFIISRAFVPVSKIRKTALAISESSDLSQRIRIGAGRDEICQLANTFDEMLDKIEQTFEREKQFTADASHELRTPVAVILSECEYMTDCAKTEAEFKESAASIGRQADRMSHLINELLMISRMDRDALTLNFEQTDVSELVSFVCDEQEEIHGENNIALVRNIAPDITLAADRFLLARAMINLIANAYQYSKENGSVTVTLTKEGNDIVFSVADTGVGIEAEHLPKIWERFYQADASRSAREKGSMGLGLSMVKWIVERHGGSAVVESTPDIGSTFTLRIPKTEN